MLPFTTSLLRLSLLMPLEIARAYAEACLPTASIVPPKPPAPKADPPMGAAVVPVEAMSSGNRAPSDQSTNSAKAMSTQFYDTQVNTVDYQILFTKRDREALLDCGRVIVTSAMSDSGFASWQISLFIRKLNSKAGGPGGAPTPADGIPKPADWTDDQAIELAAEVYRPAGADVERVIGLKPENLKYLQVDHQIISTFDRKPSRDEVGALREIAAAIKNRP